MSLRVKLSDIVDALEMVSDTRFVYLHSPTGKLVTVTDDELRAAERDDDPSERSEWEGEATPTYSVAFFIFYPFV